MTISYVRSWLTTTLLLVLLSGCGGPTVPDSAGESETSGESEAVPQTFPDEPAAHALYDQMIEAMHKAESLSFVSRCRVKMEGKVSGGTYRAWLKKPS